MAWRFHGRARVNPKYPEAFGRCDRCGFWYSLVDLHYQMEWRGPRLMNIRLRVCQKCMDIPFIFNKPIVIPPDPVPVRDPRLDDFAYYNGPQGSGAVAGSGGSNPLPPLPWPTQPLG